MAKSFLATMTDREFRRLSEFISAECGIKMPHTKKVMLETRLRKRLKNHEMGSFREYCDYLFSSDGMKNELIHMIDVVTTNKTDFFREPTHFEYIIQKVLPMLIETYGAGFKRKLFTWSVGCSTGEEPYSLAMVLSEFAENHPGFRFEILSTDISTRVLDSAYCGIYKEEKIACIPAYLKKKYFLMSRDRARGLVRVIPELREMITFKRLNLMQEDFKIRDRMDIILFRNVLIYFDKQTQEIVLNRLCNHLRPQGYLFVGHSETLTGLSVPSLQHENPTIYRRNDDYFLKKEHSVNGNRSRCAVDSRINLTVNV
jgi:chemotaxis protein methyltransferase CheR